MGMSYYLVNEATKQVLYLGKAYWLMDHDWPYDVPYDVAKVESLAAAQVNDGSEFVATVIAWMRQHGPAFLYSEALEDRWVGFHWRTSNPGWTVTDADSNTCAGDDVWPVGEQNTDGVAL